ncbi:MAG TPA: hypothetical protein VMX38_17825 [Verrucomicrobiae bacterium]|jgi:hypothetical protein|nr:hypothetical protein [Verrucomicrobiae bacterium]
MSYRITQLSPQTSTRVSNIRVLVREDLPPERVKSMQFLRSWFEYDSQAVSKPGKHLNWNAVLGIGLTVGVSAVFWSAVGLMIDRLVK